MEELIESLKNIGLNGNEAKVYLALLKKHPLTGYEVAKFADISQARAYDTLKALETANIVSVTCDKPQKYVPLKPKELTKRFRRQIESNLNFLEKKLPDVKEDLQEPIYAINNVSEIRKKLSELIKSATKEIFLEIWSYEYKYIEQDIINAYDKGLDIKLIACDNFDCRFGQIYKNQVPLNYKKRSVFIIIDNSEGIFGRAEESVIWTKNEDILSVLKGYIIRNMYVSDIETNFPEQLKYFYGSGLKKLHDKILGNKYY